LKKKRLAKDEPVTCFPVKPEALTSAGLAENLQRVAMHPADAYALRANRISEPVAQAFAITDDVEAQERIFAKVTLCGRC